MDQVILAVFVAILGGMVASALGWAESNEPFIPRKFIVAIIRAGVGGMAISIVFLEAHPVLVTVDYLVLLLAAMDIDLGLSKIAKIVGKLKNPTNSA